MTIIKDTDINFKDLLKIINGIDNTIIKTGWIDRKKGNKRSKSTVDNVALAAIHEFGAMAGRGGKTKIPARPFMRPTFDKHKEEYETQVERGVVVSLRSRNIVAFKTTSEVIGMRMKSDTVKTIDSLPRDLAPSTIQKKGSSKALVDTGQLRQSINYFVSKK